jgi:hypothetical protein
MPGLSFGGRVRLAGHTDRLRRRSERMPVSAERRRQSAGYRRAVRNRADEHRYGTRVRDPRRMRAAPVHDDPRQSSRGRRVSRERRLRTFSRLVPVGKQRTGGCRCSHPSRDQYRDEGMFGPVRGMRVRLQRARRCVQLEQVLRQGRSDVLFLQRLLDVLVLFPEHADRAWNRLRKHRHRTEPACRGRERRG